tara:strand:- start:687 stop:1763 length:1077 start_codon:yes stop_codon:yes gene_type:complete
VNPKIAVIGGGVIGNTTAWHLARLGHQINHFDPKFDQKENKSGFLSGSRASLGVLMGNIYSKSSGRSWRLRKRSMELWPIWISLLKKYDNELIINQPFIKVAKSENEALLMKKIIDRKKNYLLEFISKEETKRITEGLEIKCFGAILSEKDGWIDPKKLQDSITIAKREEGIVSINKKVVSIERQLSQGKKKWQVVLENKDIVTADILIICAAMKTNELLKNLGYVIPLEAILGQALTIEVDTSNVVNLPSIINYNNFNLISTKKGELTIGATMEACILPSKLKLEELKTIKSLGPEWIKQSNIIAQWYGLRAKPINQSSPILEELEKGLIVATGHYRNGILLAPATAEWVEKVIDNY